MPSAFLPSRRCGFARYRLRQLRDKNYAFFVTHLKKVCYRNKRKHGAQKPPRVFFSYLFHFVFCRCRFLLSATAIFFEKLVNNVGFFLDYIYI